MNLKMRKTSFSKGVLAGLQQGSVSIPYLFLENYRHIGLTEYDAMFMIQLWTYKQMEQNHFPTLEELQARMSASSEQVINTIERLMKNGFITIDEHIEQSTGVRHEQYNLQPALEKLAAYYTDQLEHQKVASAVETAGEKDLFSVFEMEFGRLLSPMECETITSWLDQDRYSEELVLTALKEAVFAGKLHFRYIDRILQEWSYHHVKTVQEAKAYTQRFRGQR